MKYSFAKSIEQLESSAVRDILKLTQGSDVISFAGGLPAEEFFPVEAVKQAYIKLLDSGKNALQYGLTDGYLPLREQICQRLASKNIHVGPENMILTTGSQQALDLLGRVYLEQGDVILVENPTYLAALQSFRSYGVRVVAVESDNDGMNLEDLQAKIKAHRPKLIYVVPTFSNPAGRVWSTERRLGLLKACKMNDILLLEDDPYGEIKFDDQAEYPPIISLDDHPADSPVVYLSTFSKTVAPAMRTGWAVADKRVIQAIGKAKQAADLHSSSIDQQALYYLLGDFNLDEHIVKIRHNYKARMQLMNDLLAEKNLPEVKWTKPAGGMFFWVEVSPQVHTEQLLKMAIKEGVAFVPGTPFFAETPLTNTLRLNYTHTDEETMREGMNRFAKAMNQYLTAHV